MIKKGIFFIIFLFLLIIPVYADVIKLNVQTEVVNDVIISELNEPAIFNLKITNLGPTDNFEIYNLLGISMSPKGTFKIESGQIKEVEVRALLPEKYRAQSGFFNFVYKIRGQDSGIQDEILTVNVAKIQDAVEVGAYDIDPESEAAIIYVINKVNHDFTNLNSNFNSAFFTFSESFSLGPLSLKEFTAPINKDQTRTLEAGNYIVTAEIELENIKKTLEGNIRFVEKTGISTSEKKSGVIISSLIITKNNEGNLPTVAQVSVSKNAISRLFTSFSLEPDSVERTGFIIEYKWQSELRPGENIQVKITTNWTYPLLILLGIIIIVFLAYVYTKSNLVLKKKVSFVHTKSGDLALKIIIHAKARKFVEKILVVDKLPPLVKLHERFGSIEPDKVDHKNKRLEWNVDALQAGEERIFTYIVYSKVGIVGKFELPPANAVFEREGKIHETESNKAFFVAEQRSIREE
ncbi:MAG: hypothetical protein ABIH72_01840 [archaeon]